MSLDLDAGFAEGPRGGYKCPCEALSFLQRVSPAAEDGLTILRVPGDLNGIRTGPADKHKCRRCLPGPLSLSFVVRALDSIGGGPILLLMTSDKEMSWVEGAASPPSPAGLHHSLSTERVAVVAPVSKAFMQRIGELIRDQHPAVALETIKEWTRQEERAPRVMCHPGWLRSDSDVE